MGDCARRQANVVAHYRGPLPPSLEDARRTWILRTSDVLLRDRGLRFSPTCGRYRGPDLPCATETPSPPVGLLSFQVTVAAGRTRPAPDEVAIVRCSSCLGLRNRLSQPRHRCSLPGLPARRDRAPRDLLGLVARTLQRGGVRRVGSRDLGSPLAAVPCASESLQQRVCRYQSAAGSSSDAAAHHRRPWIRALRPVCEGAGRHLNLP